MLAEHRAKTGEGRDALRREVADEYGRAFADGHHGVSLDLRVRGEDALGEACQDGLGKVEVLQAGLVSIGACARARRGDISMHSPSSEARPKSEDKSMHPTRAKRGPKKRTSMATASLVVRREVSASAAPASVMVVVSASTSETSDLRGGMAAFMCVCAARELCACEMGLEVEVGDVGGVELVMVEGCRWQAPRRSASAPLLVKWLAASHANEKKK